MNDEDLNAFLIEHRRKNFKSEVCHARFGVNKSEMSISVSHNGHQFSTISLLPNEAKILMRQMREFLKKNK